MNETRHALVVEDDVELRLLMLRLLRHLDFAAIGFGSAEAALAWLAMQPADALDLLTVDLRLPGVSGLSVCDHLRAAALRVPVIVVTGSTAKEDREAIAERGAYWLAKPFDALTYRSVVEQLVPPLRVTRSQRPQGVHFLTSADHWRAPCWSATS